MSTNTLPAAQRWRGMGVVCARRKDLVPCVGARAHVHMG